MAGRYTTTAEARRERELVAVVLSNIQYNKPSQNKQYRITRWLRWYGRNRNWM